MTCTGMDTRGDVRCQELRFQRLERVPFAATTGCQQVATRRGVAASTAPGGGDSKTTCNNIVVLHDAKCTPRLLTPAGPVERPLFPRRSGYLSLTIQPLQQPPGMWHGGLLWSVRLSPVQKEWQQDPHSQPWSETAFSIEPCPVSAAAPCAEETRNAAGEGRVQGNRSRGRQVARHAAARPHSYCRLRWATPRSARPSSTSDCALMRLLQGRRRRSRKHGQGKRQTCTGR